MAAGEVIGNGNTGGTTFGRTPTEKTSFHGVAPVVQAAAIADIANDASGTVIATAVNAIIAALEGKGIIASE